jgi:predicted membrane protein (TIGR00267 family)
VKLLDQLTLLLDITRSHEIARRYFVVNGFDGALTMLGIIIGFYHTDNTPLTVVISACLGAAIALGMSGISSAYISEAAERQKSLKELEDAMVTDLEDTAHGLAARLIPIAIAIVNGFAPFLISLLIMLPLWFAHLTGDWALQPLEQSIAVALGMIFLLGVFLGRVSGHYWFIAGLRTLFIALITAAIIILLTPG